jgi:hypothetical protein
VSGAASQPRALFLLPDGSVLPDSLVCSGQVPADLKGEPCPYADGGRCPSAVPLEAEDTRYTVDKGQPSDLAPPCIKQQLANLRHWQGHDGAQYPEELLDLRLFKCRQWFWLVVPGLLDADPTRLQMQS